MHKGIVCLTFDDGRDDNFSVFLDFLLSNQIPVTLNVTTGYVDGSCPEELRPSARKSMTVQDVVSLFKSSLVEIAAHGDMHLNTDEDIDRGRLKLLDWLGLENTHKIGFASPSSKFSLDRLGENGSWLRQHQFSYIALGQRIGRRRIIKLLCRKAGRLVHMPALYEIAYKDTLMEHCENGVIYRVSVLKDTTVRQIRRLIQRCAKEKKALFLMFHSIDSQAEDNWTWDIKKFDDLCQYLIKMRNDGSIELCTAERAIRLMEQ